MKTVSNLETRLGTLISRSQSDIEFSAALVALLKSGEEELLEECIKLEIAAIVYFEHEQRGLSFLTLPEWALAFNKTDQQVGKLFSVLEEISVILKNHNIDVLLLKNTGIAKIGSLPCGANPMGDIDLLVRADHLVKVDKLMLENGFVRMAEKQGIEPHEFEYVLNRGGAKLRVEVQTRPVSGRWISSEQEPSGDFLWDNAKRIGVTNCFTFTPELALLLVGLHTAKHSFVRAPGFRLHTDVDRIVAGSNIDWAAFLLLARTFKVTVPVYFSLELARRFLGTKIPKFVLNDLKPSGLKVYFIETSLKRVGFLDPMAPKWSRVGYILFVVALFDDNKQFLRSVFPDLSLPSYGYQALNQKYGFFAHAIRIVDLMFNRKNH